MIRILSSLLLALVLAMTSQSMAVARGASAATGMMVICTGTGPVAVYTDAEGQPTAAPHLCPDATLHVLVHTGATFDVVIGGLIPLGWAATRAQSDALSMLRPRPPARAPPLRL